MEFVLSELSRARRRAKRRGRSDGRQSLPPPTWKGGPVPYLITLHSQYTNKSNALKLKVQRVQAQGVIATDDDIARQAALKYKLDSSNKERSLYEEYLTKLTEESIGKADDNPLNRASRDRHIPGFIYILALISLVVGEYFVTLPATKIILNDDDWKAWIITGSFSALSILAAHLVGLSLKINMDRDKPQPVGQKWGAIAIFIFLSIVVLLLSAVRSRTVSSVPVKFGLSDKVFGTLLFFTIQISFILCAIALSYFFHSEIESQLRATRRKIKRLTNKIQRITRALNTPGEGLIDPEKFKILAAALDYDLQVLDSEYHELCSHYVQANIRSQKTKPEQVGPGLICPPLNLKNNTSIEN